MSGVAQTLAEAAGRAMGAKAAAAEKKSEDG
jgi:hypothetical protein